MELIDKILFFVPECESDVEADVAAELLPLGGRVVRLLHVPRQTLLPTDRFLVHMRHCVETRGEWTHRPAATDLILLRNQMLKGVDCIFAFPNIPP